MARPSKLTQDQWGDIHKRMLAGETARALGREFGVSEAAIRKKFGANQSVSAQSSQVRTVAEKLAESSAALAALPIGQRQIAVDLASKLRNISASLASAAELGAATAHRLNALANSEVAKVDDAQPLSSIENLKGVGVLTKLANDSAHVALNLLNANKGAAEKANADDGLGDIGATERAARVAQIMAAAQRRKEADAREA